MKHLSWLTMLALAAQPLAAQQPFGGAPQPTAPDSSAPAALEGVKKSIDSFTGDTSWQTKYGRLDDPQGCGRSDLAIVWELTRGPKDRAEALQVQYIDVQKPFHRVRSLGMTAAVLNLDGRFVDGSLRPLSSKRIYDRTILVEAQHIDTTNARSVEEQATFVLPDSTLRLVADAKVAKIRVRGTERTCDGTVEQNMKDRLHTLLAAVR